MDNPGKTIVEHFDKKELNAILKFCPAKLFKDGVNAVLTTNYTYSK